MRLSGRLERLETERHAAHEAWLRSLTHDEFMAYYRDLERSDPEQMAYLATLSEEQLQKIVDGGKL